MTDERRLAVLRALFERVLRPADYPGAWAGNVGKGVAGEVGGDAILNGGLDRLDAEAAAVFGSGFPELHPAQQDELLDRIELDQVRTRWDEPAAADWLQRIVNVIGTAYHAQPGDGAAGERETTGAEPKQPERDQ